MKRNHGIGRRLWQERPEGNWESTCLKYIVYSMRLGQSGVLMFKIHCVQCETLKEGTEKGEGRCCLLALQELLF